MIIDDREALEIGRELAKLTSPSELPLGELSDALLISLGKIAFKLVAPKVLEMIEPTQAMIDAGSERCCLWEQDDDPDLIAISVFTAMIDKMREDYGG